MPDEDVCPKCGRVMRLHSKIAGCPAPVVPVHQAVDAQLEEVRDLDPSPFDD